MMQDAKLYTVQEVADLWQVHRATVLRLIEAGKLGATKVGRQWRLTESDVKSYLDKNGLRVEGAEE